MRPGGLLIYNSSLIDREPGRADIRVIAVPAVEMARNLGLIESPTCVCWARISPPPA